MSSQKTRNELRTLTECAVMLALSVVLSFIKIYEPPYGGSVTLCSQLPLVIVSYRHGLKWGAITGFCAAVIQMLFGFNNFSYVTGILAVLVLAFTDYLIPFTCLGLGGMFRKLIKNQPLSVALGSVVVSLIRFACHYVSGVTIWRGYATEGMAVPIYSLVYNGSFMLPEALITAVAGFLICLVLDFSRSEGIRGRG